MSRVSKQDFWGDPTFPQVFRACGTDPYFGSQCLAGFSNGSSVHVSLCSEVKDLQHRVLLSGHDTCAVGLVVSVAVGGSVKSATMASTRSSAAATRVLTLEVPARRFRLGFGPARSKGLFVKIVFRCRRFAGKRRDRDWHVRHRLVGLAGREPDCVRSHGNDGALHLGVGTCSAHLLDTSGMVQDGFLAFAQIAGAGRMAMTFRHSLE